MLVTVLVTAVGDVTLVTTADYDQWAASSIDGVLLVQYAKHSRRIAALQMLRSAGLVTVCDRPTPAE